MRANRRCAAVFSGSMTAVKRAIPRARAASASAVAERAPQALALQAVADDDGHLGGARFEASRTQRPTPARRRGSSCEDGDERVVVDLVDLGQVAQLGRG